MMMSAISPGLPSKEYYQDHDLVKSYSETIGLVLEALLREARPDARPSHTEELPFECSEDLVRAVVKFESALAFAAPSEEDAEDVTKYYNPKSLEDVKSLLPQVSMRYLLSVLAPTGFTPAKIIVGSPSYLKALSQELEATASETLRAFFVWKAVQAYVNEVEDEAVVPLKRFNNQLRGKDPDALEERWRTCVRSADRGLGKSICQPIYIIAKSS